MVEILTVMVLTLMKVGLNIIDLWRLFKCLVFVIAPNKLNFLLVYSVLSI